MRNLQCLFPQIIQPTQIWYADRPPKLGGTPTKISIAAIHDKTNNTFVYSENIFLETAAQVNLSTLHSQQQMYPHILKFLGNMNHDKLVICHMNKEVGCGVFTREKIQLGEIVAFYAGELKKTSPIRDSKEASYSIDVDSFTGKSDYYIDAYKLGGIARFLQHLPSNSETLAKELISIFKQDPLKIGTYLTRNLPTDQFKEDEIVQIAHALEQDILRGEGQEIRNMLASCGQMEAEKKDWQLRRIDLNDICWSQIACANLDMATVIMNNKPIIFFTASRDIDIGEQLGFDYGLGYWTHLNQLPLLFDKQGEVIPKKTYRYIEMPFAIQMQQSERGFFYSSARYKEDINRQSPIQFSTSTYPVSFFWVRKNLAENNVISTKNLPLTHLNTFTIDLKRLLPDETKVELYESNPEAEDCAKRNIFDAVCTFKSNKDWRTVYNLIKDSCIEALCIYHQSTLEIIIKEININPSKMYQFIKDNTTNNRSVCKI